MTETEQQAIEWKREWKDDCLKWICGYANAFFRSGEIEAWGRGIWRIFQACKEAGTPKPILQYEPNDLWLEFPFSKEYLKAISHAEPVEAQVEAQEAQDVARVELTPIERNLLMACNKTPRSGQQLLEIAGYASRTGNFKRSMDKLLQSDLLGMTFPEKPRSRNQTYQTTEKGRKVLKQVEKEGGRP